MTNTPPLSNAEEKHTMKLHYANKPARSAFTHYALKAALYAAIAFDFYAVFYVVYVEENDPMVLEQPIATVADGSSKE